MMKKRLMGIVLCLALLVTAAAASTGSVQKDLYYSNISITVNGKAITPTDVNGLSTEPFIIDGTTYLPIRAIAEALDCDVNWDSAANTVAVTTKNSLIFDVTAYENIT